jgi:DNA-binding response OmpR family regulator
MDILIVEDDHPSRKILSLTLKTLEHNVDEAENGKEGWEMWQCKKYQLVISDWVMPDMSGLDLCRLIREKNLSKYTYFIMLTMMSGKEKFLTAMEAGVDDFIQKPFDRDQLFARIRVATRILNLHTEISTLSGLVPICSYCKKIRDDKNYWQRVESYIESKSDAKFSHGICPDCYINVMKPKLDELKQKELLTKNKPVDPINHN